MEFIARDVVSPDWTQKKAIYSLIGMEAEDGSIVKIKQFIGEFTREELETQKAQILIQVSDYDTKLAFFN